ncbi:MAG: hypothetical protein RLZZ117_843 [Cyanobacteriota bacterium]
MQRGNRIRAREQLGSGTRDQRDLDSQRQLGPGPGLQPRQIELGGPGGQAIAASGHQFLTAVGEFPDPTQAIPQDQRSAVIQGLAARAIGQAQALAARVGRIRLLQKGQRPAAASLIFHQPAARLESEGPGRSGHHCQQQGHGQRCDAGEDSPAPQGRQA